MVNNTTLNDMNKNHERKNILNNTDLSKVLKQISTIN